MNLFTGTVAYYRYYRPGIPTEVADILHAAAPRHSPRRLLDIGTGTGLVVEALLDRFDDTIAIDSDTEMLTAAEQSLRPRISERARLVLERSSAEGFTPPWGWTADLVTICRTFHWLEQAAVLNRLDDQVASNGAVAIFGDSSFWTTRSPWKDAVREVVQSFLGERRRAGGGMFHHQDRPFREILRESPFGHVEEARVPVRRLWTSESIIGYLYSTSFAAPYLFGDRRGDFETALTRRLAEFSDDDTFIEHNEFVILIGYRESEK